MSSCLSNENPLDNLKSRDFVYQKNEIKIFKMDNIYYQLIPSLQQTALSNGQHPNDPSNLLVQHV